MLLFQGCVKDSHKEAAQKIRISASGASNTRAALDGDGMTVRWTNDDALGVYMKCPENTIQSCRYNIVPGSFNGQDDNDADFEGALEWGSQAGDFTFYGYNPLRRDLQAEPENVLVTLPPSRTKQGSTTLHYSNGYFSVAEPCVVVSNGTRSEPAEVPLKFHHLFPLVELRFAALNSSDLVIERVMLRSSGDLSVEDAVLDITKSKGEAGFAVLCGGSRHKMVWLSIDGAPAVPATEDPDFSTSGQAETPADVFAVRMNILPGEHALTIVVMTNKGTFKFTKPEKEFVRGKRYVSTLVLDPLNSNVGAWDGTSTPADYSGNTIGISTAQEFFWLCKVSKYQVAPWNLKGYDIRLNSDLDLENAEWNDMILLRNCNFDGCGHTIYNVKITSGGVNTGFFSVLGNATLKNLHVEGVISLDDAAYDSKIGGICGRMENGSHMSGCSFTGRIEVNGDKASVGGLCGYMTGGSRITASANYADVENLEPSGSETLMGGIVGYVTGGHVIASYNMGSVVNGNRAGGIVGQTSGSSTYKALYNAGSISNPANQIYGLGGTPQTLTGCYYVSTDGGAGQCASFSGSAWPEAGSVPEWGTGNSDGSGAGHYWSSLGGWNGGYPAYPSLWWE